jgi:formylmethanofuran dehydrogenase subunit E
MTPADRRTLFRTFTEEIAAIEAALQRWTEFQEEAPGVPTFTNWRQDMQDRLEGLRAARNRMHDEAYGVCQECGEDISPRRLLAMPGASLCVACKSEHEHALAIP